MPHGYVVRAYVRAVETNTIFHVSVVISRRNPRGGNAVLALGIVAPVVVGT